MTAAVQSNLAYIRNSHTPSRKSWTSGLFSFRADVPGGAGGSPAETLRFASFRRPKPLAMPTFHRGRAARAPRLFRFLQAPLSETLEP